EMLAAKQRSGSEAVAVATIAEEAERCRRVAHNLLNFASQSDSHRTQFDLNALTRGVIDLRAYDLRAASIDVQVDLQEDLPPVVGDYGEIQQLVYNLVDNAYYALGAEDGGTLEIVTWAEGDEVHLRVADSGPGIPEKLLGRIFEPFVTTKPRGEGTGLGLAICRRILEVHGGEISGHNRPGGGASFDAVLPASGARASAPPEKSREASEKSPTPDGSVEVLFIDDEPSLCALVDEYLSRRGHSVTVVQTGEEGLEKAVEGDFDVIVCDMRLPGISGEDVCMGLLDRKPEAAERIVVATGDVLSPQTQSFFDRSGLPHIHKPFKLNQLEAAIARIMEGSPVREA
ncbi:MAG: hybrid sensor histidine kinase/response regulator, partial [Armatimonadota bacterium]